jgi:GTP-binding protein
MVDYVHISVKAGNGGGGHVSFKIARGKPFGEADGGDGGRGGNVVIVPSKDLNTLAPYRFKKNFEADSGGNGGRNNRRGADSEDLLLEVPLGTLVKDSKGGLIFDLTKYEDRVLVAEGGKGGRGNSHLRHEILERKKQGERGLIRVFERGAQGEEIELTLELKVLADLGLVGFPNAGKSTLISKLTAARPKIADYPFTTLEPNLGVMHYKNKEIVIADIPGLIEGASSGKGLGDQFLRHLERTRLLVHLIAIDSPEPLQNYEIINKELADYSNILQGIPQIVCLNKIDLVAEDLVKKVEEGFKKKKIKVLKISALAEIGLEELKSEILKRFKK